MLGIGLFSQFLSFSILNLSILVKTYLLQFELFSVNMNKMTWWYHDATTSLFSKNIHTISISAISVFITGTTSCNRTLPQSTVQIHFIQKAFLYFTDYNSDLRILKSRFCWLSLLRFLSFYFMLQKQKPLAISWAQHVLPYIDVSVYASPGMFSSKFFFSDCLLSSFNYQMRYYLFWGADAMFPQ